MTTFNLNEIIPSEAVHPGEFLKDELHARGLRQKVFSEMAGIPASVISEIIKGKRSINADYSIAFEKVLDIPADYFMSLQNQYDLDKARIQSVSKAKREAIEKEHELNSVINLGEVYERLDIRVPVYKRVDRLLSVIGSTYGSITGRTALAGYFKRSDKRDIDIRNIRTWILLAQYEASNIDVRSRFSKESADLAADRIVHEAHTGTLTESRIYDILSEGGIAYAVVKKLPMCPVDAYSVMLDDYPAIVVTHRYDDMQKLIFDVLHELGHIVRHMTGSKYDGFISSSDYSQDNKPESEANEYARDKLIPPAIWAKIIGGSIPSASPHIVCAHIGRNAIEYGIDPRIAVARYKHDSREYRGRAYANTKIV